ncbi:cytohesin-4 [Thecamonas trahens ATCC 50062]|uniref:Cytohesin-4 n=1 Tax=Thecamonas trahens ATCC 50062 TaxID=461836 RepID=A0A0L0DPL7_THETB|nr:cytohesin-4 [Thecamonas trahens ATCC 50062]KNC53966.1 cytohesin-4 [Thecamonas trahens ATCC 50062]|eukprot:XP_013754168.1 cytohesin-4 [Thecamonas trahens ATCC 50062]
MDVNVARSQRLLARTQYDRVQKDVSSLDAEIAAMEEEIRAEEEARALEAALGSDDEATSSLGSISSSSDLHPMLTRPVDGSSDLYVLVRKPGTRKDTISRDRFGRPLVIAASQAEREATSDGLVYLNDDGPSTEVASQDRHAGPMIGAAAMGVTGSRLSIAEVVDDGSSLHTKERLLANAAKRFNKKPAECWQYMEERGLFADGGSPQERAGWLLKLPGLKKSQIGAYLGSDKPGIDEVVTAFSKLFDYADLSVLEALRMFLATFRLPGEAQKIDRLMESFASRYVTHNPGLFANADTVYILAFALIMLQTDLHNPSIKRKMTKDEFSSRLRGIDGGSDVDTQLLAALYDDIAANPIAMEVEDETAATFADANKKGYLRKRGGRIPTWRRRYFVLTGHCLYYFKSEEDPAPKGILPLESLALRLSDVKPHAFEIYSPTQDKIKTGKRTGGKMEEGHHKSLLMAASSSEEREEWMDVIAKNMASSPYQYLARCRGAVW